MPMLMLDSEIENEDWSATVAALDLIFMLLDTHC